MVIDKKSPPSPSPKGSRVEMNEDALLEFLEEEMAVKAYFNASPHIIRKEGREFKLSGRDAAIEQAAECMEIISRPADKADKEVRKIPVCSGLSGLGKTRMLEEWEQIFDKAEIGSHRLGVLVPYYNGFLPQPVEKCMTIEASFSWRLLYRCFLHGN